jgi:hypothetical protein
MIENRITLSAVLYGCESLSLTPREECVREEAALENIWTKSEEVTGSLKSDNEKIQNFHCLPNISRIITSKGHCITEHVA